MLTKYQTERYNEVTEEYEYPALNIVYQAKEGYRENQISPKDPIEIIIELIVNPEDPAYSSTIEEIALIHEHCATHYEECCKEMI